MLPTTQGSTRIITLWTSFHTCCLVAQSYPVFCHPMAKRSPPGSSVYGISQTRILEWLANSFSKGSSQPREWICIVGRFFTAEPALAGGSFTTEPPGKPSFHTAAAAAAAAKSLQSCPTLRPHRRQPTRLPCSSDSLGKNTGVGCHFLLQCMKVKSESEVAQSRQTLSDPMDCSLPGSSVHGIFQARVLEWVAAFILHLF